MILSEQETGAPSPQLLKQFTQKESMLIKYECFQWGAHQEMRKSIFVLLTTIMALYLLHVLASALCEHPASWLSPPLAHQNTSQVCKTELLYLAQESCSISSYHLKTKITPGNTCSQHNLPRIWNSIHAREPVQLAQTDANTQCGQMAAAWEPCFTFDHFSPLFSIILRGGNNTSSLQRHIYPHQYKPLATETSSTCWDLVRAGVQPAPALWGSASQQVQNGLLGTFILILSFVSNIPKHLPQGKVTAQKQRHPGSVQGRIPSCPKSLTAQAMRRKQRRGEGKREAKGARVRRASRESQTSRKCMEGRQEQGARKVMWKHTQLSLWRFWREESLLSGRQQLNGWSVRRWEQC